MIKLLLVLALAVAALEADPQQQKPFSWLLDSEQWGSKNESSIQPTGIFNSCGGSLNLTDSLQVIQIGSFGPGIRCVWSIAMGPFNTLQVYTDSLDFEVGPSGLSLFTFATTRTYNLTRNKLPAGSQQIYSYPAFNVALLTFTSTRNGAGFRVGVRGSGTSNPQWRTGTHHFQDAASGIFKSHTGKYNPWERSSVVIQPYMNYGLEVRVTELDVGHLVEPSMFGLTIYTPPAYHTTSDDDDYREFIGYYPFGPAGSTTISTEPRLFVLSTGLTMVPSIPGTGYSLRWNH